MLQDERNSHPEVALTKALQGWQRKMWTAMPGVLQGAVASDGTVEVQVAISGVFRNEAGVESPKSISKLVKVPLCFPGGGGFTATFPVASGDEVLVVFASRCIDGWWQSSGVQPQVEQRMHDLSDGFAIPGPRSAPRALSGYSTTTMQLRSDDGTSYIEMAPAGVVNIVAPGGFNVTAPNANISESAVAITVPVTTTGNVTAGFGGGDQVDLQFHVHTSGTAGSPTSVPTPGS
jgi:hypothetical protein